MIHWLNNGHEFWDQTLLKDLLKGYSGKRKVFVVPGANIDVDEVNMEMEGIPKVLVIVTSDEENKFAVEQLYHPNMKVFMNYPDPVRHRSLDGFMPVGYCPDTRKLVKENGMSAKSQDWFFAGQVTHDSRRKCVEALKDLPDGKLVGSEGFAQGLPYPEYIQNLCRSKIIPCPEGYASPDSFRLYEALEAGCIPIVRNKAFWTLMFGEVPFPVVNEWAELPDLINHLKDRPDIANRCSAWWQLKKRELRWKILQSQS